MFSNVGELRETEREGFEPSVNKSLHSSSNATPWTTRPSLLHNDYDRESERIASCSYSIVRWVQTLESILAIKTENFSSKKEFFLRARELGEKDNIIFFWKTVKNNNNKDISCLPRRRRRSYLFLIFQSMNWNESTDRSILLDYGEWIPLDHNYLFIQIQFP